MATLIPIEGETTEVAAPKDRAALCAVLGGASTRFNTAPDGSTWWNTIPEEVTVNQRATRFYSARWGAGTAAAGSYTMFGLVLYLSADETKVFNGAPADPMVPVTGKTYDVKEKLKTIGARWNADKRVWMVHQSRLQEALDIVRKGP